MRSSLNAAFIGCGAIAQKKHLPLAAENPCLHIKALYNPTKSVAENCKAAFGNADTVVVNSADEIFAKDDIDVVFIASPNYTHADYTIAALQSGKSVICEKPMAMTSEQAQSMLDASIRYGRLLHVSYQNRYTYQAQYAKRLVEDGFLSKIYYAKAYALRRRAVPNWGITTNRQLQGGGPLIDIGSHAIDLALWLADCFEPLYAAGTAYSDIARKGSEANFWGPWDPVKNTVEDCALGFVVMKNGMTLSVESSYAMNISEEKEASVDLYGTAGGLELRQQNGLTLIHELGGQMCVSTNALQETVRTLTPESRTMTASQREHEAVMKLLLDGKNFDPGAAQAVAVTKIVEALYTSAESKLPVMF